MNARGLSYPQWVARQRRRERIEQTFTVAALVAAALGLGWLLLG